MFIFLSIAGGWRYVMSKHKTDFNSDNTVVWAVAIPLLSLAVAQLFYVVITV